MVITLILSSFFVETTGLGAMAFQICVYIENGGRVNKYFVGNVCTMLLLALVYIVIAKEGTSDTKGSLRMYSIIMGDEGASLKLAKRINSVHVSI